MVLEDYEAERLQSNSFRIFNPLILVENDPWNYLGDSTIRGRKLFGFRWVEKDTVIDGKKVYLENDLWLNPANFLPEFYSRRAYQDGERSQLIEATFDGWELKENAERFVLDFPKGI